MRKAALCLLFLIPLLAFAQKTPPEKELKALTKESLTAFNKAVQDQDFTSFHGYISALWRKEITSDKLATIFRPFVEQKIDLAPLIGIDPVFSQPAKVDSDGILTVQGTYPSTPNKVDFRLKYLYEQNAWKLAGIKVDVVPAASSDGKIPSEKDARAMVLDSLLAFNRAVQQKSFVDFHKQKIAALWRAQITAGQLLDIFETFIEQEADISGVAKLEPTFDQPPAVNDDGMLELNGFYATKPNRVRFQLGYLYEEPEWKLVRVNVQVRPEGAAAPEGDGE
ncbi:hypothetical protein BH20VER2_BH20VER2_08470 [soil metagenome]